MNTKFCFIDLETSGLDAKKEKILEFGCIITDSKLNEIETYCAIPHVPINSLQMDEWCIKTHTESGLLEEVAKSTLTLEDIDRDMTKILRRHFPVVRPAAAGSSISFDKAFIKEHLPAIDAKFHYRIIDVSSFMLAMSIYHNFKAERVRSEAVHRTLPDIRDSIAYLKIYLDKFTC